MNVDSAVALVNSLVFIPNWKFTATDHTSRFEATILVRCDYPCRRSEREFAPKYKERIVAYATLPIIVYDCDDECLYYHVVEMVEEIQLHEIREFLRVEPTMWAPFHPHRVDGMRRWAKRRGTHVMADLRFGLA